MDLIPIRVVPNTNRSLEDDGAFLLFFVCGTGRLITIKMKVKTVAFLEFFWAFSWLMWDFCLFGFFLFLKLTDSSVKYIVREFCSFMVKGAKGFLCVTSFTSHSYLVGSCCKSTSQVKNWGSARLSTLCQVMHRVSGKVRGQIQTWGWLQSPHPSQLTLWQFILRRSQDREYPASCMVEGHVQVEWCGISNPWLWAVAQSEGAELGGGNQKQHFIFTSVPLLSPMF